MRDGVIPAHYVLNAKHYRPEFRGVKVPGDVIRNLPEKGFLVGAVNCLFVFKDFHHIQDFKDVRRLLRHANARNLLNRDQQQRPIIFLQP